MHPLPSPRIALLFCLACPPLFAQPWDHSSPEGVAAGTFAISARRDSLGLVAVGSAKTDSLTVTNTGSTTLTISSVKSSNAVFTAGPASASILAGASRKFGITFAPSATGNQSAYIVFTHNGASSPDTVAATGTAGLAGFLLNKKSIAYGFVVINRGKPDSVSVTNTGNAPLVISAVTSTSGRFTINPTSGTIQPGAKGTFSITFTPSTSTAVSAKIIFTHNAPSLKDTVAVSGTGTAFAPNRRSIAFGGVPTGTSRKDSVVVTNAGNTTLTVSAVSSTNGVFTVSPANATIAAAGTAKFYVTFTPPDTASQSGFVIFTHTGSSSPDTVGVSGTGMTPGFAVNRKFIPFGTVAIGSPKQDSVTVTSTGNTALVISGVSSGSSLFTVSPASGTVQPGQSKKFYITFTPSTNTLQYASIVFMHNAPSRRDTLTVSGTGVAPLEPPALAAPPGGATGQAVPVQLLWNAVSGASGYWVQCATDSLFRNIILSDTSVHTTSRTVSGLPPNAPCSWRVATGNLAGFGRFSAPWQFTTVATGNVAGTIAFSGDASSTSYRMFGLPGIGARTAGALLPGTQKMDWRLLRDTGKDTTYPAYYEDLTAGSLINTGEGYWLLLRSSLVIARTDSLPPLGPDGTYAIALHGGWNMITNPFTVSVGRDAVIAANGLPAGTAFWEHIGAVRTSTGGTTLDPFKGYYFDNGSANLASLKIPYPFSTSVGKRAAKAPAVDWRLELVFDGDINTDRDNYAGIAPSAGSGPNELDQHEAPLVFDEGFLYFNRPAWDAARSRFASDIRPALGEGQKWDFEVWNPRMGQGKITVNGVSAVPSQYQVVLVDPLNSTPADMRRANTYAYATSSKTMQFTLIVGTQAFVDAEVAQLVPRSFELEQNYPNPFNPSTTITYLLPAPADVRLEILTVLGQRVRVLESGFRPAATHTVVWDGRDDRGQTVASGVYFCRLVAGGTLTKTRKLLLVK
ncbi:MAG TPA: choice-of-anchor D domain-containing protein [Bacteroidota bacterium]|nr:choice-of-anchor D domain-containing protein [Bacteroidota bacterium]